MPVPTIYLRDHFSLPEAVSLEQKQTLEAAKDTQSGQSCDRKAPSPTLVVLRELGPQPELGLNG